MIFFSMSNFSWRWRPSCRPIACNTQHASHSCPALLGGDVLAEHPGTHDLLFHVQLLLATLLHVPLDCGGRHQTQHQHFTCLAYSVSPCNRLLVVLRVPVKVEEYDRIRSLQV